MLTRADCQKCGSSQTLITPVGAIDYYNFKVKVQCLSCQHVKYMTVPIPQYDMAEQTKNEIEREKDERSN
jgi:hypothetical protein